MRVEISLGLLFPCALKGLPSGRQVRLDSANHANILIEKIVQIWSSNSLLDVPEVFLQKVANVACRVPNIRQEKFMT